MITVSPIDVLSTQARQAVVVTGKKQRKVVPISGVNGIANGNSKIEGDADLITSSPITSSATARRKGILHVSPPLKLAFLMYTFIISLLW